MKTPERDLDEERERDREEGEQAEDDCCHGAQRDEPDADDGDPARERLARERPQRVAGVRLPRLPKGKVDGEGDADEAEQARDANRDVQHRRRFRVHEVAASGLPSTVVGSTNATIGTRNVTSSSG